jgi:hypothetical protein
MSGWVVVALMATIFACRCRVRHTPHHTSGVAPTWSRRARGGGC